MSKPTRSEMTSPVMGTVIAIQANYYQVQLQGGLHQDILQEGSDRPVVQLLCTRRSRLKKVGEQVMVGDQVVVVEPDWLGHRGAIASILPRQSHLSRPPIANVDQILLMFALAEPKIEPQQLTRFLITAEQTHLPIILCFNKRDLTGYRTQKAWRDRLQHWGYHPLLVSLRTGAGLTVLERSLRHRITVVAGLSGVGKSSLINHFVPNVDLRVSQVSQRWGQGRHTTRHVELFELPQGGFLADTPGFNQPNLELLPTQLADCFPEIRQRLSQTQCQFKNCQHIDEPNCVVRGDWERYPIYVSLLAEVTVQQAKLQMTTMPETRTKRKSRKQGQTQHEPKLETKRYRRPSRRQLQQDLQNLDWDMDPLEPLSP